VNLLGSRCPYFSGTNILKISIKVNRCHLMLFIAILVILIIIVLVYITKEQVVAHLKRGDIDGALRVLQMFDKVD
jgi:hypothetical protein